jgi:hypothetical protein
MKTCGKNERIAPSFSTSALDGCEWLASESVWTLWGTEKSLTPAGNWTPAVRTLARRYTDWTIPPAPLNCDVPTPNSRTPPRVIFIFGVISCHSISGVYSVGRKDDWWIMMNLEGSCRGPNEVLSRHFPGSTKENHEQHQSRQPICQLRFEPNTPGKQVHIVTCRPACAVTRYSSEIMRGAIPPLLYKVFIGWSLMKSDIYS